MQRNASSRCFQFLCHVGSPLLMGSTSFVRIGTTFADSILTFRPLQPSCRLFHLFANSVGIVYVA